MTQPNDGSGSVRRRPKEPQTRLIGVRPPRQIYRSRAMSFCVGDRAGSGRSLWSDLAGQSGRIVSPGGAGEECGHDVRGVAVEGDSGSVVAHGGAGIGMAGGFLHIAQRYPGVERSGDECVAEGVGAHALGDPRPSRDAAHDPSGRVSIDPPPVDSHEERPVAAFADRQIDGAGRPGRERDGHDLASLAQDRERAVPPLQAHGAPNRAAFDLNRREIHEATMKGRWL
jgi:hypothetical protein